MANRKGLSQAGAVLVIGLVLLLVVTVIGVSALQTTALQERMTGNLRQSNTAFQAAEAGLQAALAYIAQLQYPPGARGVTTEGFLFSVCTLSPVYDEEKKSTIPCDAEKSLASHGVASTYLNNLGITAVKLKGVTEDPRIFIEQRLIPSVEADAGSRGGGTYYYTVTAVGYGPTTTARAVLRSTVAKRYR